MPSGPGASKWWGIAMNQMKAKGCKSFKKGSRCRIMAGNRAEMLAAKNKKR